MGEAVSYEKVNAGGPLWKSFRAAAAVAAQLA
jgi:hypothetical protein